MLRALLLSALSFIATWAVAGAIGAMVLPRRLLPTELDLTVISAVVALGVFVQQLWRRRGVDRIGA